MRRIFDIAGKDLLQTLRDRKTFMFLLLMPIAFTLFFGFAFGGFDQSPADNRLPVGYLDLDNGQLSPEFHTLLANSTVIRLDEDPQRSAADLDQLVTDGDLAAAVIVPEGYSQSVLDGMPMKLTFIADPSNSSASTIQGEALTLVNRLVGAVRTAGIAVQTTGDPSKFDSAFAEALAAWQNPPVQMEVTKFPAWHGHKCVCQLLV